MQQLNLPKYEFKIKEENNHKFIFDEIRKKYLKLTPEEWVRQNFIKYLNHEKLYPLSLIGVEIGFDINNICLRSDIVLYNKKAEPLILVECKAPNIKITEKTFDQLGVYNLYFKSLLYIVTNGLSHYCFRKKSESNLFEFLKDIPTYSEISD